MAAKRSYAAKKTLPRQGLRWAALDCRGGGENCRCAQFNEPSFDPVGVACHRKPVDRLPQLQRVLTDLVKLIELEHYDASRAAEPDNAHVAKL